MKSSRRFTILLSLLLATAAAAGVYFLVASQKPDSVATAQVPPTSTSVPTVPVLVAKQDIPADTTLTADLVEVKQVPAESKNARALSSAGEAVGKTTAVTLTQGEQILDLRLTEAAPGSPGDTFAGKVPVGMRAISVVFDEVIGAGALVQPGDHVDVLAYFAFDVKQFSIQGSGQASDNANSTNGNGTDASKPDYTQYVTTYVVQDVEVLAVSQAMSPDELGVSVQGSAPTPTPTVSATAAADKAPVARPDAKSVTLAVNPEQAQRLFLASEAAVNNQGSLRLAMRAPGDTTTTNVGPAKLGNIPLGGLLGDVAQPMTPTDLVITEAYLLERIVPSGGLLEFTATVKNVSDHVIKSGKDAAPGYVYTQGSAYDAVGFFPQGGTYRIGLNVAGAYPNQYPYRWALGQDLKPGESVVVTGSVRLTEPTPDTKYWLGVIQEPNSVTQDGVNVSDITVIQSETATVDAATANMRAAADNTSAIVLELRKGDALQIVQAQGGWFQVRFGQKEGWIEASALTVPPLEGAPVGATPVAG